MKYLTAIIILYFSNICLSQNDLNRIRQKLEVENIFINDYKLIKKGYVPSYEEGFKAKDFYFGEYYVFKKGKHKIYLIKAMNRTPYINKEDNVIIVNMCVSFFKITNI